MQNPLRTAARGLTLLTIIVGVTPLPTFAQVAEAPEFEIENAVLDTSILFVIGAQEAVQELRGAFGWPTFQEGLAAGIYYRFDPDGYARFAPTPRLDTDVFEVTCRSRTVTCQANKGILGISSTNTGQFQLIIADYVEGEQFYLIEGTTEIQLPAQILKPLDARLETLLSSNGELVVRRGADERARVSLAGFGQTVAYLRWVAARQDYTALPQGWPIPNGAIAASPRLTVPDTWNNPMAPNQIESVPAPLASVELAIDPDVDALRREVETLRSLVSLSEFAIAPSQAEPPESAAVTPSTIEPLLDADAARLAALEAMVTKLSAGLVTTPICGADQPLPCFSDSLAVSEPSDAALSANSPLDVVTPHLGLEPVMVTTDASAPELVPDIASLTESAPIVTTEPNEAPPLKTAQKDKAAQVEYLMNEIGLDAETALMVLQIGPLGLELPANATEGCTDSTLGLAFSDEMTRQALADMTAEIPRGGFNVATQPEASSFNLGPITPTDEPITEFVLLSDYLRSVFPPNG